MGREEVAKNGFIRDYLKPFLIALIVALAVRTFFIQAFTIPSGSMEPTLLVGDYLLVNKFTYGIRIPGTNKRFLPVEERPRRGEIIVFLYPVDPSKDFIKRVIGLSGEKVQIIQNKIYINDRPIEDPWGYFKPVGWEELFQLENFGPVLVPPDSLFVMGDNRNNSLDSRYWGFLPLDEVVGKAWVIYFSWNGKAESPLDKVRWSRIGKPIR